MSEKDELVQKVSYLSKSEGGKARGLSMWPSSAINLELYVELLVMPNSSLVEN